MIEKVNKDDYMDLIEKLDEAYNEFYLFTQNEVKTSDMGFTVTLNYDRLKLLADNVQGYAKKLSQIRKQKR